MFSKVTPNLHLLARTNMATGFGRDDFTHDGTVDLKGFPSERSKGGRWKACFFIVGYVLFERMAFNAVALNFGFYLKEKLHQEMQSSTQNVMIVWLGSVFITPIMGAYIADAHFGRYWTIVVSSAIYLVGMLLLIVAVSIPGLRPTCGPGVALVDCHKQASPCQIGLFYLAHHIISIGVGGTKANISTLGADQFDDFEPKERCQKLSFFNWWMFSILFLSPYASVFIKRLQEEISWTLGYSIATLGLSVSVIVFLVGTPFYRHKVPSGSPFLRMARVLVAALRKWSLPIPSDPNDLYELGLDEYAKTGKYRISHTPSLRILDKAAIKSSVTSPWNLCPVTQVEETKQMIKMIPILLVTCIPTSLSSYVVVLFIKQGSTLDRTMVHNFQIPISCLTLIVTTFTLISIVIYDLLFVPAIRRCTQNPRGITLLQRMAIGIVFHIVLIVMACLTENTILRVDRHKTESSPPTVFILLPLFALMGVAGAFLEVAKDEFFYDQAPESMKSLGSSYYSSTWGVENSLGTFLVTSVLDGVRDYGYQWLNPENIKLSQLGYYYGFCGVLNVINFIFFLIVAKFYLYNIQVTESEKEMCYPMEMFQAKGNTQLDKSSDMEITEVNTQVDESLEMDKTELE